MNKKMLSLLLVSAMTISLCGCGREAAQIASSDGSSQIATVTEEKADEEVPQTADSKTAADDDKDDSKIENNADDASDDGEEIVIGANVIPNGDFSTESSKWGLYKESGGSASFTTSGKMKVKITAPGKKAHSVQIYCDGFELLQGAEYELSFDISSDVPRTFEYRIQLNGGDYHPYVSDAYVDIGPEVTHISRNFEMSEASDPSPRLCFNLGDAKQEQGLSKHEVIIDNVSLVILNADNAKKVDISVDEKEIMINQVGYRPSDEKRAVFKDASKDTEFEVYDAKTNKSVYSGKLTAGKSKGSSGDKVAYGDFSDLTKPGTYYIHSENSGNSFVFEISDDIYAETFDSVCRMLYLQRCGVELTEEYAGDFAHPKCHTEKATIYGTNTTIDVSGGWHDAGDYGRYVSPAATTVADLMLAYEQYPDAFSDESGIPESGNGVPDILDETRVELEWMMKMQAKDGGVYHKVTGLSFDGVVLPQNCTEKLYVLPESKTATGDFAAAMFMASRVYADIDPAFAKKCLGVAKKALPYLEDRLNDSNFTNPADCSTGEYPDSTAMDEYLWALCEGYKTTKDSAYVDKLKTFNYKRIEELEGLGWQTVTGFAYYAILSMDEELQGVPFDFEKAFFDNVNEVYDISMVESYGSSIKDEYTWGSNMTICNNGILMLMATELTGDEKYLQTAKYQADYIYGVNCKSYCYVTGEGTLSPKSPHHRPSQVLEEAMPGMVIGGPDSNLEDPFAASVLRGLPKAACYVDNAQSYSCNEITIYWNSPLIYLLAGLMTE